jgi:hypothetical protein
VTQLAAVPEMPADPPANDPAPFEMPAHFRRGKGSKQLRAAWDDLIASTDRALQARDMRFTFEFAATLMAKFRRGTPMTATESKELKRLLVSLGLAKDEGGDPEKKKGKLSGYIR